MSSLSTDSASPDLLTSVQHLGDKWHGAGSLSDEALAEIYRIGQARALQNTLETGCGRSSLIFSHISRRHTVFTFTNSDTHYKADDSYERVRSSPLFNARTTEFVLGPTQKTIPAYAFQEPYDLVLLDGPHSYPFHDLEYYFVYPHVRQDGYLIVDDIHIPTIYNMFTFIKEDAMFALDKIVHNTAFFTRTDAPLFNPYGDDWEGQAYNKNRFPAYPPPPPAYSKLAKRLLPAPLKTALKKMLKV